MAGSAKKHLVVPIFIPFAGCPHKCIFCEQKKISGVSDQTEILETLDIAVSSPYFYDIENREIAFYGGTFTNLPLKTMEEMLLSVLPYVKSGKFKSIRISTRPDAINDDICALLKDKGVRTVEIGVQSMNDKVLMQAGRGHKAVDTSRAMELLHKYDFISGVQLMPGLPGDSLKLFMDTIADIIALKPDLARIYPAVVIKGTGLSEKFYEGCYKPLELDEAVVWCAEAATKLEERGVKVIRIGLMESLSLSKENNVIAGPYHPAFGHMVRSLQYHKRIEKYLKKSPWKKGYVLVNKNELALFCGYKNDGIMRASDALQAEIAGVRGDINIRPGTIFFEEG